MCILKCVGKDNVELLSLYDDGRDGCRLSSGVERAQSQNDERQRGRLSMRRVCCIIRSFTPKAALLEQRVAAEGFKCGMR